MSSTTTKPVIAFFGATGGCAGQALALALEAGYTCYALARTPSKLSTQLSTQYNIPTSQQSQYLTIVSGSAKDIAAVKATLYPSGAQRPASIVISGLGSVPKLTLSLVPVTLADPRICEDAMKCLLAAIEELSAQGVYRDSAASKPLVTAISTTGTDKKTRDVPLAYYGPYHYLLTVPHADKRKMESALVAAAGSSSIIRDFVVVRPTLLMDNEGVGAASLRVGWVRHPEDGRVGGTEVKGKPEMGYSISRRDVGRWIFANVIEGEGKGWEGRCVSLTA